MAGERIRKRTALPFGDEAPHGVRERVPGFHAPMWTRALVRLGWRQITGRLVFTLGLVAQLVLLWLAGELLDLYVAAVELWADLARKHLELTL